MIIVHDFTKLIDTTIGTILAELRPSYCQLHPPHQQLRSKWGDPKFRETKHTAVRARKVAEPAEAEEVPKNLLEASIKI